MPRPPCPRKALVLAAFLIGLLGPLAVAEDSANPPKPDPEREHAFELYDQGKMVEAMPLLEELAAANPKDATVAERWGAAVLSYAQTLTDPELRKKARVRSRTILLKAKELGNNSYLVQTLLGMVPEDGTEAKFSDRTEVDQAMQQAEADFARGDYDKAREGYLRALLLDPNMYYAALFTGDVFFKQDKPGFAGEWYARAIQINPNQETAYRYWGDALFKAGQSDAARGKFIDAIVAEPYNRNAWMGVSQWADRNHLKLTYLRLEDKGSVETKDGKIKINVDPSMGKDDPEGIGWMAYNMKRALWQGDEFKKNFPNETKYRRTLREEAECLHSMVLVLSEVGESKKKEGKDFPLDEPLTLLTKIDQAGLIEPFVLINRADNEIAQDYPPYREGNREKIRSYLDQFVVPKTPEKAAP